MSTSERDRELTRGLYLGFIVGMLAGITCALPVLLVNAYMNGAFFSVDVREAWQLFENFFVLGFGLMAGLSLARPL